MRNALAVSLLSLALASVAGAATLQESFDHTYDARAGATLSLDNVNGGITLRAWDQPRIQVHAVKKVTSSNDKAAKERMADLRIEATPRDGGLQLATRDPHANGGLMDWLFSPSVNASVTYEISMPRSMNVDVDNVNGTIQISDVTGELKLDTTNGRIEVERCGGSVDASTTNGSIRADLSAPAANKPMAFETTNGRITLVVPASFRANIDAATTNGAIRSDLPVTTNGFEKGSLRGVMNGGGATLRLRTTNGQIEIKTPSPATAAK